VAKTGLEAEWISPQTLATTTPEEVVMDYLSVPVSFPSSLSNWWAWPNGGWWAWSIVVALWMALAVVLVYYLGGLWK